MTKKDLETLDDYLDALRYIGTGVDFGFTEEVMKVTKSQVECKHEPIEHVDFMLRKTICKKCNKTLA